MNIAASPTTKEMLISRGLESFISGSYYEALNNFEEVLSDTPTDSGALYHIAGCQIQLHQLNSAQVTIEKALSIDSKDSLAWFRLGQIHYTCKQYELAIDSFGKAIELMPDFADAWFMGGQALIESGDINDGMLALKSALTFNPSSMVFNEVFGRHFIENKRHIGTLIVSGNLQEILTNIPFLLENKVFNLKIVLITDCKEVEQLFKAISIPVYQTILCDGKSEITKTQNHISKSREHYLCPKKWL
ncbi:tetratricopeptide repeat protein [Polynucleobacter sp. 73C-SIWE]|uniref:tetratricopeptide repeat protein n=1 Tax=Polynucleobacter sp. 73C-SIWE TaxID=2689098 RepID=UPI001C0C6E4B|nr:tetratricopeptide repeat protein [Polynucleobacter sp. 73C-SIWE]MBU3580225.1 tetratricopeptide repeat protein [Polynucleobacter sp. 73C-SIWE]